MINNILRDLASVTGMIFLAICPFSSVSVGDVRLGVMLPLSGPMASHGNAIANGLALAMEGSDARGEKNNCKIFVEDTRYDPKETVSALRKMVATNKVNVAYTWGGAPSEAIAPIAPSIPVPVLLSTVAKIANNPYVIRFGVPGSKLAAKLNDVRVKRGFKRAIYVKTESAYINSIVEGLNDFEELDALVPDTVDFRTTITKLRTRSFDLLGVFLYPSQLPLFYQELSRQRLVTPTFATDGFESGAERQQAGAGAVGAIFAYLQVSSSFHERYLKRFNTDTQISQAGFGYDLFSLLCSAGVVNSENIVASILKVKGYRGVLGEMNCGDFSVEKRCDFPVFAKEVSAEGIKSLPD